MTRKNTLDEFISRSRQKHGDKFDYSLVKYDNTHTKVTIICPKHSKFEQKPNDHMRGLGCRMCKNESMVLTADEFTKRARAVHGMMYDYSRVTYTHSHIPVNIVCGAHGPFSQTPNAHIGQKQGCPHCFRPRGVAWRYDFLDENVRNHPAWLYVVKLRVNNKEYLKVGITKRSIARRYAGYQFEILFQHCTTLYNAWLVETELLLRMQPYRLKERIPVSGWTEILECDMITLEIQLKSLLMLVENKYVR